MLILDYELVIDKDTPYGAFSTNANGFAQRFLSVNYTLDGKDYHTKLTNVTPDKIKNQFVLQLNDEVKKAQKVDLVLTIRDKSYIINLAL